MRYTTWYDCAACLYARLYRMKVAAIPMRTVGPIRINSALAQGDFKVPMATFESPLWPSVGRGAKVSCATEGGIQVTIADDRMARSVVLQAPNAAVAVGVVEDLHVRYAQMEAIITQSSRFAHLIDIHTQIVGNLLYVRFELSTGDAAGHNMVTQAAQYLMNWMLEEYTELNLQNKKSKYSNRKLISVMMKIT